MILTYVGELFKYAIRYDQKGPWMPFSEWFRLTLANVIIHRKWGIGVYWERRENGWIREVPIQRRTFPAPSPLPPGQQYDSYFRWEWRIQMVLHRLTTGRCREKANEAPISAEPSFNGQLEMVGFTKKETPPRQAFPSGEDSGSHSG